MRKEEVELSDGRMMVRYYAKVYGLGWNPEDEWLTFEPGPTMCGDTDDGVGFSIARLLGMWAMPFDELEEMYMVALEKRRKDGT